MHVEMEIFSSSSRAISVTLTVNEAQSTTQSVGLLVARSLGWLTGGLAGWLAGWLAYQIDHSHNNHSYLRHRDDHHHRQMSPPSPHE